MFPSSDFQAICIWSFGWKIDIYASDVRPIVFCNFLLINSRCFWTFFNHASACCFELLNLLKIMVWTHRQLHVWNSVAMLLYYLLHWLHWLPECVASHAVYMLFREMHWVSRLGVSNYQATWTVCWTYLVRHVVVMSKLRWIVWEHMENEAENDSITGRNLFLRHPHAVFVLHSKYMI